MLGREGAREKDSLCWNLLFLVKLTPGAFRASTLIRARRKNSLIWRGVIWGSDAILYMVR